MRIFKMAVILPESRSEVLQNLQTDFVANIPESDPFIRVHWLFALLVAIANREFDVYTQVGQMLLQMFPTTATGTFARQWGNLKGVEINAAAPATGFITATGVTTTVIPEGTLWSNDSGTQYEALNQDYTVIDTSIIISTLISSGGVATAATSNAHHLSSGMVVDISGATQSEYNVSSATIIVTAEDAFTYVISGSPLSPATGDPIVTASFASVFVDSVDTGNIANLGSGAQISLVSSIIGVDTISYVQFTELGGGADTETPVRYRLNYLDRYQSPTAHFNASDIIAKAKEVAGVTRVFPDGLKPHVGDVTVTFMRDDDPDPIPSPQEVTDVRNKLAEITPVTTNISDTEGLIVKAPTPLTINFSFTTLTPNTSTMQAAIEARLTQLFLEGVNVGEDILATTYTLAISNSVDPATGLFVQSFSLSNPSGDITISNGEIGVLGTVSFGT